MGDMADMYREQEFDYGIDDDREEEYAMLEDEIARRSQATKHKPLISTWAIRQNSTGYFLPARKNGRGYSFDEPTKDCFPRLFKSELSATRALSAWLRGTWDQPVYDHDEWSHSDYKVAAEPTKVDSRNPHDMEIVEFVLFEVVK